MSIKSCNTNVKEWKSFTCSREVGNGSRISPDHNPRSNGGGRDQCQRWRFKPIILIILPKTAWNWKKSSNDRGLGAQVPCAPFRSGTGGVLLPLNPVTWPYKVRGLLPPANVVCEGYVFTHVCHSVHRGGGVRGCLGGVWLLRGGVCVVAPWGACVVAQGRGWGVCGCSWGVVCMVAPGEHAWLLQGGHVWLLQGGGMCGCSGGGMRGCLGGHAWLLPGGVHGIRRDTEIRSMSGRYASYWNAFLFQNGTPV